MKPAVYLRSPESITIIADFENHWIHIAPREVSWLWIPGLRQEGASRNDGGEVCAAEMRRR
jgi:hypothetical protein